MTKLKSYHSTNNGIINRTFQEAVRTAENFVNSNQDRIQLVNITITSEQIQRYINEHITIFHFAVFYYHDE